jgi:hypothetical protein
VDDKKSYKKEFFDNCILAFETFRITRKWFDKTFTAFKL